MQCLCDRGRNYYFPPPAVAGEYLRPSRTTTVYPWKGETHDYDVDVPRNRNPGAAWYYPEPKDAAKQIQDFVAFWKGVKVEA